MPLRWAAVLLAMLSCAAAPAAETVAVTGTVRYEPAADESRVPERFRLGPHEFHFVSRPLTTSATQITINEVTFPSPVETPHANNNTVHTEYFRPAAEGRFPGVIVLHILGGDFDLARLFCRTLAHNQVAALFVKLPYYGPRSEPGGPRRMVSRDPRETVRNMTQAILDIRRGRAWLASRPEIDPDQTGVFGISLGGITSSLAAAAEPRFAKVCPMLAGADIACVSWHAPELADVRNQWLAQGGTQESFAAEIAAVDPVTYADNLRGRNVLMLNARYDEVIPRVCTESLWQAYGEPEIVWFDSGHYTAARFMFDGLSHVTRFFQAKSADGALDGP
jgi:dienelactone hydrolase